MKIRPALRDAQQEEPVMHCQGRGCEIWRDEPIFAWEGKRLCLDCFKDVVESLLEDDPVMLANMMQVDVEREI